MTSTRLRPAAEQIIQLYLHLPFADKAVACPYYNNRRQRLRGALRVMIGKGSPDDIVQEAELFALREKIDLAALDNETTKKFLVDHHLGIDCSGLAYHVLNAELMARIKLPLRQVIKHPDIKNPLRKIIARLRDVENTTVATFAHNKNSATIALTAARPGDMIILKETGQDHDRDHLLIIDAVETPANQPTIIHYTHSFQWSTDGKYQHGVKQGVILVAKPAGNLTDQDWRENNQSGINNETFAHVLQARHVEIRRLQALV